MNDRNNKEPTFETCFTETSSELLQERVEVHWEHREAPSGMTERQNGQVLVVLCGGSDFGTMAVSRFTQRISMKTEKPTMRNAMTVLIKRP